MNNDFNWAAFHRRRKLYKVVGLGLVLGGLFTIIDMMSKVPIPLTGVRAVFVGLVLIIAGVLSLYHGYKLPLEEALDLVHRKGHGITESEIVHDMRVDRVTAQRIINALMRKGFLRRGSGQSTSEEVFEAVK